MGAYQNITRPSLKNRGGLTRLVIADVLDVQNSSIRVVRGEGYVSEPITLKDGASWMEVEVTPGSLVSTESTSKSRGSSLFPMELTWMVGKDSPWKIDQLMRMERSRWIALVKNANQDWIVIGTPQEPAVFEWLRRSQGEKATDFNGYELALKISRREPAAFYRIYATMYVDSNGHLLFDNTFDTTLSASLNAAGEITLIGPNADKYTVEDGHLIYTP